MRISDWSSDVCSSDLVAEARAPMPTHRVDLVDEDDARRGLLGLFEHVAHTRRTDTDEHLDEVRARNGEEGHARLTRDRAREQRLAGARDRKSTRLNSSH